MICIEDEIPFELPAGWAWTRIKSVCFINPKNNVTDNTEASFIPMPLIHDGYFNEHSYEVKKWGDIKSGFTHFAENDIGIAKITPCFENRKSVVFHNLVNGIGSGTTELFILRTIKEMIIPEYLLWIVKSNGFIQGGIQTYTGDVGQQRIRRNYLTEYLIAIPPFAEQHRILDSLNVAFSQVDLLETNHHELSNLINVVKSKILGLAIRGKLVPQNPDDEPASILLERIRAEKESLIKQGKIKRDKKESVIFKGEDNSYYEKIGNVTSCIDDFIPFEVPDSWHWYRIGDLVINFDNQRKPITKHDRKNELGLYDYYGATGAIDKVDSYIFDGEFLMIGEDGGNFFTDRENSFIASGKFWANNHVHVVQPIICDIWFLKFFLDSCDLSSMGLITGIGVPKLNQANLNKILVPIPPIEEQLLISDYIKNILNVLNSIEKSLA